MSEQISKQSLLAHIEQRQQSGDGSDELSALKMEIQTGRFDSPSNQGEVQRLRAALEYATEVLNLIAYGKPDINESRQTAREAIKEIEKALSTTTEPTGEEPDAIDHFVDAMERTGWKTDEQHKEDSHES